MKPLRIACPHCNETIDVRCCANCEHYHKHFIYIEDSDHYKSFGKGHCVYPRVKDRADNDYCPHWSGKGVK